MESVGRDVAGPLNQNGDWCSVGDFFSVYQL